MIKFDFKGKHAIVCGSTRGIGRATAELLAESGASVTLIARNAESLQAQASALSTADGQAHEYIDVDFNKPGDLRDKLDQFAARLESADILVNNSGGPPGGLAIDADPEDFRIAFNRHLIASQLLVQAVRAGMKSRGFGRIINVISTSVKSPIPGLGVSNTIRGAVANWSKTLSAELGPEGITVNNLLPGATATDRLYEIIENKARKFNLTVNEVEAQMMAEIPAGRFAAPEETAKAICFLASEDASYINGINLPVDGGRLTSL